MSQMPKFHETYLPILNILKDANVMYRKDICEKVKGTYYANLRYQRQKMQAIKSSS